MHNAHRQVRRRVAAQPRHAAADAGRRRPARPVQLQRVGHRPARATTASLSGVANSFASFLLDWPNTVQRDLKVIDEPGTKHWASFAFVQDKWQARLERHRRPRPALGVLHAARGPRRQGQPVQLRSGDQHAARRRATATPTNALNVKKQLHATSRRAPASPGASTRRTVVRAGYGASTIPFPDNRYAFNYPVKQNYTGSAANGFQRAGSMAAGLPGAGAR